MNLYDTPACRTLGQIRDRSGCELITPDELAVRVAIERRHDAKTDIAALDLDAERDARAGLCTCCGELIGPVDHCFACGTRVQKPRKM